VSKHDRPYGVNHLSDGMSLLYNSSPHSEVHPQDALRVLRPSSDMVYPLDMTNDDDVKVVVRLRELLGDTFAEQVCADAAWAREVLGRTSEPV